MGLFDKLNESPSSAAPPPAGNSLLERLQALGDSTKVNPPAPATAIGNGAKAAGGAGAVAGTPRSPPPADAMAKAMADTARTGGTVEQVAAAGATAAKTPPTPAKEHGGACPGCGKTFKQLARHKCKQSAPEKKEDPKPSPSPEKAPAAPEETVAPSNDTIEQANERPRGQEFIVLFNCGFRKRPLGFNGVMNLADWVKPVAEMVAKENGVEHFALIDFAKGGPMLAAKIDRLLSTKQHWGIILADKTSLEGRALRDVLIRHASTVIENM